MNGIVIAARELLYSPKGESDKKKLTIKVLAPHLVEEGKVNFKFTPGTACCVVEFDGIDERVEFVGMDSLQALEMVANVNRYLMGFGKKYDFYWLTGEPYFDG